MRKKESVRDRETDRDTEMRLEGTEKERKDRAMRERDMCVRKKRPKSKKWSKPLTALCL